MEGSVEGGGTKVEEERELSWVRNGRKFFCQQHYRGISM